MPIILEKNFVAQRTMLRDMRSLYVRMVSFWGKNDTVATTMVFLASCLFPPYEGVPHFQNYWEFILLIAFWYWRWAMFKQAFVMPYKFPANAGVPDPHNPPPGKRGAGKSEGIMFIGNCNDTGDDDHGREIWLTNSDVRTHVLYIGTTGSGKTEGLKSLVTNALTWGSGFVYVDGKADTDLWASLYALARRFGRDDDLLILNYMTANSDDGATSNTMNPFSNGSASYLSNMVTSLMPDAGGDNAMWKERAVALLSALMPALTWKRDKQGLLLDVSVLRDYIELRPIISLSRDPNLPERIVRGLAGYLNTLPGYVDAAFDDEGNERPPSPDQPMYDLQVARQQHGYLSMQFTRSLQSLADEYGYIFKAQLADIDVLDVVLNRRILVALIPSLEKSADEAANLGKIISASLKGMMGATLGNTVEGSWEMAICSKQTRSSSSFMTVFDEVGYYTAPGMAVMAAQARSLGFSLVFAAQDLPSMEKRVKQEAQSILGNCNLKIFGKIEDPMGTADFLQKHAGTSWVMESTGSTAPTNTVASMFFDRPFVDDRKAGGMQLRARVCYDHLRNYHEGEAAVFFGDFTHAAKIFFAKPEPVSGLRVHRLLPVPGTTTASAARERAITELSLRLKDVDWTADKAAVPATASTEVATMVEKMKGDASTALKNGIAALIAVAAVKPSSRNAAKSSAAAKQEAKAAATPSSWSLPATDEDDDDAFLNTKPTQKSNASTSDNGADVDVDALKAHAAAKSDLPAWQEGDQFAVMELENFFEQAFNDDTPDEETEIDVSEILEAEKKSDLPPAVTAAVQDSAEKLNEGLSTQDK